MKYTLLSIRVKDTNLDPFGDCRAKAAYINSAGSHLGYLIAFHGEKYEKQLDQARRWLLAQIKECRSDIATNLIIDEKDVDNGSE